MKHLLYIVLITIVLSGCTAAKETSITTEHTPLSSQPISNQLAETTEVDIIKRSFDDVAENDTGWQKSLFKVISDTETVYSEDKLDGSESRLVRYNWDTNQSAVLWQGQQKIISIERVPDNEDKQELEFARRRETKQHVGLSSHKEKYRN
ncbi:hypothetical protein SD71_10220 [Cohnella kolymensis]|uniref:DUF4362 domain-containing protein n=1 Tax=Cohnella kolymensis TaxID=1590652 RepID=A0ABR5A4B4_9BACL|nr:hypothetical protein [Cohnella kolymensis]KIL35782.1 hypothetical protein SD71_10220 [Cohnella kolymensis]